MMQPVTASFGIPPGALASLADTRTTPGDLSLLRAGLHSRRLVLLRSLLAQADRHRVQPSVRQQLDLHWRLLERAESDDPPAARAALAYPSVGNWLVHALSIPLGERAAFEDLLGGLGALAAAVALRTGTRFRLTLPARDGRLVLPGIGAYFTHAARVRVVAGPRSLLLSPGHRRGRLPLLPPYARATGAGWRGLRPLPGGVAVLDDVDPHRTGPHPSARPSPPAGAGQARDWAARWHAALALLESADPARRAEVASLVRSVVPMRRPPGGTVSATLRSAPWAVLAGLPGTARETAAVLVHEVQHSKLAVLGDLTTLHHGDGEAVFRVPWRSDPRPLDAVLQGTYAHLALADLWHRLADRPGAAPAAREAARARCEDYREQVGPALVLLRGSGELTRRGAEFTTAMGRHHASLEKRTARRRTGVEQTSRNGDVR